MIDNKLYEIFTKVKTTETRINKGKRNNCEFRAGHQRTMDRKNCGQHNFEKINLRLRSQIRLARTWR